MKKFLGDTPGVLICLHEKDGRVQCPPIDRIRHRKIMIEGSLQEQQAQFLAVLLQLLPTSKLVVACPDQFKEAVQQTLDAVGFKNTLLL